MREGVLDAAPGDDYWFVLDGDAAARSRHALPARGPARALAGGGHRGVRLDRRRVASRRRSRDLVLYELHVGTFSAEGTFDAAIPHLAGPARARASTRSS